MPKEKQLINESAQDDFDEQTALLKKFSEELDKVIAEERELTKEATLIERKLIKLDPAHMDLSNKIGNTVRDLPFIDFMSPYYKVDQVVVNDLTDNVNFTRVPKVDRCMTKDQVAFKFHECPSGDEPHSKGDFSTFM